MNSYLPGIHLIATLQTNSTNKIATHEAFGSCIQQLIKQHSLTNLGTIFHNFSPAGFTAVVCLSESHISIHTWPEFGKINLDIYLSNFKRNNDGTVHAIFNELVHFFEATIVDEHLIQR